MIYFEDQFRVCVLYKSGNAIEFWATKFSIKPGYAGSLTYEWAAAEPKECRPISMSIDNIEAVWQTGVRKKLKFGVKPQEEK